VHQVLVPKHLFQHNKPLSKFRPITPVVLLLIFLGVRMSGVNSLEAFKGVKINLGKIFKVQSNYRPS